MTSALHHRKPESNSNHPADATQYPVAAHASSAAPDDASNHAATKRQALADAFAHGERTGLVRLQGGPYKFREAVEAARHSPVDATWSLARAFAAVRSMARQWLGYPQERQPLTMDVPRKPLVNLGRPFVIDTPPDDPQARKAFRERLVRESQHRQAVVHTLTLDGLIGVVAFEGKRIGASLHIDAAALMQFVQRVVYELRLRQNMSFVAWINEVAVDEDLYNPAKLRDMCNITGSQLRHGSAGSRCLVIV